jgi:hypothetical protein
MATWLYFVDYDDYRQSDPTYLASLFDTRTPNTGMLCGVAESGGYEPESPKGAVERYVRAYDAALGGNFAGADELCIDSIISIRAGGTRQNVGYFHSHSMEVIHNPASERITRARLDDGRYLRVLDSGPDSVSVEVPALDQPEGLTLADTDMPGWNVYATGHQLNVMRTSDGLRRVKLSASLVAETVTFRYEPDSWRIGVFITLISVAVACGCGLHAVLSRDRKVRVAV